MSAVTAEDTVNDVRFNQDGGAFVCALDSGVRIFNLEPLAELASYGAAQFGSVSICEMLYRTNLIAIVGGGSTPRFADNTVLVYDDSTSAFVLELTFTAPVLAVRMRRDRLVVVLRRQVHVFAFPGDCRRLMTVNSGDNPLGLCALTPLSSCERQLLVFPARKCGALRLLQLADAESRVSSAPVAISAHQTALAAVAVNQQGTLVATASRVGTLVRVWDTASRQLVTELRRGSDTAVLHCITFCAASSFLCCCSDKGTIHVFSVRRPALNRRSALAGIGLPGQYLHSQWALATCTLPGVEQRRRCACAFGAAPGTVYAAGVDGTLHKYVFNAEGSCNREAYDVYLDVCGRNDF